MALGVMDGADLNFPNMLERLNKSLLPNDSLGSLNPPSGAMPHSIARLWFRAISLLSLRTARLAVLTRLSTEVYRV